MKVRVRWFSLSEVWIILAGLGAGGINAVVGSGSLITYPVLLSIGYAPLIANVSNTVGLVPGSISASIGYRREIAPQRRRVVALLPASLAGACVGAFLLLNFPNAFSAVVPYLILFAVVLLIVQPRLSRMITSSRHDSKRVPITFVGVFLTGIYGGYFGAAQGVILIAFLAIGFDETLQRLNGVKNVLALGVNGIAAVLFLFLSPVSLRVAVTIAVASFTGGFLGARYGRRIPDRVLRAIIAVGGLAVSIKLIFF